MKKEILFCLLFSITSWMWSQQDVQYSQYMYNMSVVNPAYTTNELGVVNMGVLHRRQWVGVEGAPSSSNFFAHAPVGSNVELGVSIVNDNIGDIITENNLSADFAYKLYLKRSSVLSFGFKVGANIFDANFDGLSLESGDVFTDPDFDQNIDRTFLNVGFGIYYNNDKFFAGLSVPNFLETAHLNENNGVFYGTEAVHYFFTSGYVFDVNKNLRIKPSVLVKAVEGAPAILDVNLNAMYNDRVELGVGYRLNDAIIGMANFEVLPGFRIGYAYDYITSNLGSFGSGSHEIFLLYNLDTLLQGYTKSPRFF